MRNTREFPLNGESMTNVGAAANANQSKVLPFDCELVSLAVALSTAITTTATVLTITLNGSASTITFTLPVGFVRGVVYPSARVEYSAGDQVHVVSGGETDAIPTAETTWVLKPT